MNGLIQGKDAILCFDKNGFLPFVCASDISLSLSSDELPIRTKTKNGKGHWKKVTYKDASYSVTLSGLLKFDDTNFTGWDILDNWFGFVHLTFRIAFTDDQSNTRSVQGEAMIKTNTLNISAGALVKNDFELSGNGELMIFDGLIPCDSQITFITVTGQTADDGIIHVSWTYTGAPYQIKYRLDDTGDYIYGLADTTLDIPSLALGAHSIEIIPVCLNGYEGMGLTNAFTITRGLTCSSVITDINITSTNANPVYTGSPAFYKYRIDGGAWTTLSITSKVPLTGLGVGAHTIEMVPICSNGVEGTGGSKDFTVASQPAQSSIAWSFATVATHPAASLNIYVNGVLVVNENATDSGSIIAPTGSSVKAVLSCFDDSGKHMNLVIENTSTSVALYHGINTSPFTDQYIFSPDGSDYSITGTIS